VRSRFVNTCYRCSTLIAPRDTLTVTSPAYSRPAPAVPERRLGTAGVCAGVRSRCSHPPSPLFPRLYATIAGASMSVASVW